MKKYLVINPDRPEFQHLKNTAVEKTIEYVHHSKVRPTRKEGFRHHVIEQIVREGWKPEKGLALPAVFEDGEFVLFNGNHRFLGLKKLGHDMIPIFRITEKERDESNRNGGVFAFWLVVPDIL